MALSSGDKNVSFGDKTTDGVLQTTRLYEKQSATHEVAPKTSTSLTGKEIEAKNAKSGLEEVVMGK